MIIHIYTSICLPLRSDISTSTLTSLTDLQGVLVTIGSRHPGGHHVGVAYCLHLVDVVEVNHGVKHLPEFVEKLDDLVCGADGADGGEADDVTEEDAGAVKYLRLHLLPLLQLLYDGL